MEGFEAGGGFGDEAGVEVAGVDVNLVGGDADIDFTEANLDLAVRWAEGPGDLEGVQIGPAERVVLGEGEVRRPVTSGDIAGMFQRHEKTEDA